MNEKHLTTITWTGIQIYLGRNIVVQVDICVWMCLCVVCSVQNNVKGIGTLLIWWPRWCSLLPQLSAPSVGTVAFCPQCGHRGSPSGRVFKSTGLEVERTNWSWRELCVMSQKEFLSALYSTPACSFSSWSFCVVVSLFVSVSTNLRSPCLNLSVSAYHFPISLVFSFTCIFLFLCIDVIPLSTKIGIQ